MKLKLLATLLTLFLVLQSQSPANAQNWYDEEEAEEDQIPVDGGDDDASVLTDDPRPDLICEKNRMCTCQSDVKGTKNGNVVDCSRASLNSAPLDTAHLSIRQEKNPNFKAHIVRLDHNHIDVLKYEMIMPGQENNILELDFSFNVISVIEKMSFDKFPKLLKLKLTHNKLRDYEISDDWLNKKLGNSLHQLYLDYNYLRSLDNGIFDNLTNLTKLVLDGNQGLVLTPATFGKKLNKLRTLSLDNCGMEKLDNDLFASLPNLAQLSLSGNKFTSLPLALNKIPKLSIVALSGIELSTLPKSSFKRNPQLKSIYMRRMPNLHTVEECAFCGMENLELVDFTGSKKLETIDDNAFGKMSTKDATLENLKSVLLADCGLTSLSENLLDWEQIEKFTLHGNPLVCDCTKMQWLMGKKQKVHFTEAQPTCAGPESLKGVALKKADSQACGIKEATSNDKMTLIVVLVGLCASIFIVGFFYARSKGGIRQFLPASGRPASPQLGYSNLTARGGAAHHNELEDGDENRLEEDFNRPEFV